MMMTIEQFLQSNPEIVFKKPQQDFILTEDQDVLVSASAGTGKTTSMIKKLAYLILFKKIEVNELLVVTYTNSAANEMKQDLFKELSNLLSIEKDKNTISYLSNQIEKLSFADIGTLHSVCKKWTNKYFYEVGAETTFSIVSDKEQQYILNLSIDNVFSDYTISNDEDFYYLFDMYNNSRDDKNLKQMVVKLIEFLNSKVEIEKWKNNVLDNTYNDDVSKNICAQYIFNYVKKEYLYHENICNNYLQIANNCNLSKYVLALQNRSDLINVVKNANNFYDLCVSVNEFKLINKPTENAKNGNLDFQVEVGEWIDDFKKLKTDLDKYLIADKDISEKINNVKKVVIKLFEVVDKCIEAYSKLKKDRQYLDFSDLEKYTMQILKNPQILAEIKNSYKYLFVDEYQDVNEVQEFIIKSIKQKNNLNMIGDVKQSIYKFRLSNPKIFLDKYFDRTNNKIILFNENFRSEDNILQFTNTICNELITNETIGINYKKDANLISGKGNSKNTVVQMDLVNKLNSENKVINKIIVSEKEGRIIADNIANLIQNGIEKNGVVVPVTYKDIVILVKKKKDYCKTIYETLKTYNIPVNTTIKTNIFNEVEVIVLHSYLKIINNSNDDLSMASILLSPIVKLNENEIIKVKNYSDNLFYENVLNYDYDDEIKNKVQTFLKSVDYYRDYLNTHTVYETIIKIINNYDLINYYKSFADGIQKECNILEFVNYSKSESFNYSLTRFLDYVGDLKTEESSINTNYSDNCVRIDTMHSSKGLGYPIVFLAGLGEELHPKNNNSNLLIDDDLGIALQFLSSENRNKQCSIMYNAVKIKNSFEDVCEDIRLLYVALTRAKNRLFLIGSFNALKINIIKKLQLTKCSTQLDLLFKSFSNNDLQFVKNLKSSFDVFSGSQKAVVYIHNGDCDNTVKNNNKVKLLPQNQSSLQTDLTTYFNYKNNSNIQNIALKNSVTSILKEETDYENLIVAPSKLVMFEDNNNPEMALELGKIYHYVMQQLNYTEDLQDIENIILKTMNSGEFNINLVKMIEPKKVLNAVTTIKKLLNSNSKIKKEQRFILLAPHNEIVKNSKSSDNVIVQGIIDLIIENNDANIIIDFKTNKNTDENYLKNCYALQLKLYALAYKKAYKKAVNKKYLYLFENNSLIEV